MTLSVVDTVSSRLELGFPSPAEWVDTSAEYTADELRIARHPVMQAWEEPYMDMLAGIATANGGRVLEVGYGMGLSSRAVLRRPSVTGYEVIECHPDVVTRAVTHLRGEIGSGRVRLHVGFWQDVVPGLRDGSFDGLLFDTYPLRPEEVHGNHFPFLAEAFRLLRPGGVFTYYSDEPTGLSPAHVARLRAAGFAEVDGMVCPVSPPADCEYWQSDSIVAPVVRKAAA